MNIEDDFHHVLLAVTGLSPSVITETIYALHKANKPIPKRIIIITTKQGETKIREQLVIPGILKKLCHDYGLPKITLDYNDLHVVKNKTNEPMDDASSQEDHEAMANYICHIVKDLTNQHNVAIYASIAGGRKTMTFLLGYAMSIFGREQDRLSHVLVDKKYEVSGFYYPTPSSHIIEVNNKPVDAKDAEVFLSEIPIVRLRDNLSTELLEKASSYSETVNWLNINPANQTLTLNVSKRTITFCNYTTDPLPPAEFAFYHWFCDRAIKDLPGLRIPIKGPSEIEPEKIESYAVDFLKYYSLLQDQFTVEDLSNGALKDGMDREYFEGRKTNTHKRLKALGDRLFNEIMICIIGKENRVNLFGIKLNPEFIDIVEE